MALGFAEKLKAARQKAGLTQTQLSELSGVDQRVLSRWELGKAKPEREALKKVGLHIDLGVSRSNSGGPGKVEAAKVTPGVRYVQTLAFYRSQKKVSIADLSAKSGVSEGVISGMEHGKLPCVEPWLTPLARALGVPPGYVYNNVPGICDYLGDDIKSLDKKYPQPERLIDYWGGQSTVVDITAPCRECGWCGKKHEGLACKEVDLADVP